MINDNQASYIHIGVWQYSMARISRFSDSIEDLHSDTALCLSSTFCFLVWLRPEFSINPVPSGSFKKIYAAWKAMLFCKNTKTPEDALAQTHTCLGTRGKSRKSMKVTTILLQEWTPHLDVRTQQYPTPMKVPNYGYQVNVTVYLRLKCIQHGVVQKHTGEIWRLVPVHPYCKDQPEKTTQICQRNLPQELKLLFCSIVCDTFR